MRRATTSSGEAFSTQYTLRSAVTQTPRPKSIPHWQFGRLQLGILSHGNQQNAELDLSAPQSAERSRGGCACHCDRTSLSHRSAAFIALADARCFELLKIKGSALITHLLKELFFVRLTPRDQITGDRDSIPTMPSVNSLLTATNSLFAASWHITNNVSAISAQHASIVRAL